MQAVTLQRLMGMNGCCCLIDEQYTRLRDITMARLNQVMLELDQSAARLLLTANQLKNRPQGFIAFGFHDDIGFVHVAGYIDIHTAHAGHGFQDVGGH